MHGGTGQHGTRRGVFPTPYPRGSLSWGSTTKKGSRSVDRKQTYDGGGCASIFENNHVAPVRVCACVFVVARPHAVVRRVLVLLR